jgi:hypothetical protein
MAKNKLVIIPFGSLILALGGDEFERAVERGREFSAQHNGSPHAETERVLTAEQLEKETSVPASWWLQAARENRIPCLKCGKYTRFVWSQAIEALKVRKR